MMTSMSEHETPRSIGSQQARGGFGWIKDVAVPLVVAVVAFVGTGVGAYLATSGAQSAQQMQMQEDRRKDDQAKRAEAYLGFLNSTLSYAGVLNDSIRTCQESHSEASESACAYRAYRQNLPPARKMLSAYLAAQVYGTPEGSKATSDLYNVFPTDSNREFDPGKFSDLAARFLDLACRELPNIPKATCT
jgi:hypothetical protein